MSIATTLVTSFFITAVPSSIDSQDQQFFLDKNDAYHQNMLSSLEKNYNKLFSEVEEYKTLGDKWDGYSGIQPSDEIIETTKEFLSILKQNNIIKPDIFPSPKGEIGIFWRKDNKYIEVDFVKKGYLSFFYDFNNDLYGEVDFPINDGIPEKLHKALSNLLEESTSETKFSLSMTKSELVDRFLVS